MQQSVRSGFVSDSTCSDSKDCTDVICYFKYVHRIWFASQPRLLDMYAKKDTELFTRSIYEKFAASENEALACRDRFMKAHGIDCNKKKTQKRNEWYLIGSSARAFGTLEDLLFMWYNMDISLPEGSYRHATTRAPARQHPLPYLPESLRGKLYPVLSAKHSGVQDMARFLGAMPPHPKIKTEIHGRPVELRISLKVPNSRRVSIEVWRKFLDEKKTLKSERLGTEELKAEASLRRIHLSLQCALMPEYMRSQDEARPTPEANLIEPPASIRAHALDYGNHDSDPGPYATKKAISGTVTSKTLIDLFQKAKMDSNTVFLDIGSGIGEPMIAAAGWFQVRLALGFEVHKERVEESLRGILEHGVSRAFPIHVSVEEICHFDPVTHVYCYTNGMDSCARNCIRESILVSKSVQFVMTDREHLLRYGSNEASAFEKVGSATMVMAGSGGKKRQFYVLQRVGQRITRDLKNNVNFHPIFALPIYMLRFDRAQEHAFLMKYVAMLKNFNYRPIYCCAMKQIDAVAAENDSVPSSTCVPTQTRSITKRKECSVAFSSDDDVQSSRQRRLRRRRKPAKETVSAALAFDCDFVQV